MVIVDDNIITGSVTNQTDNKRGGVSFPAREMVWELLLYNYFVVIEFRYGFKEYILE